MNLEKLDCDKTGGDKTERDVIVWTVGGLRAVFDVARAAWVSMTAPEDPQGTEFLLTPSEFPELDGEHARWLGTVQLSVDGDDRSTDRRVFTSDLCAERQVEVDDDQIVVTYRSSDQIGLAVRQVYRRTEAGITWTTTLSNPGASELTLRQVGVPLPMNQHFRNDDTFKYEQCVLRHALLAHGHSWIYWSKSSGDMPLLVLKTMADSTLDSFDVDHDDPAWGTKESFGASFEGIYTVYSVNEVSDVFPVRTGPKVLKPGKDLTLSFLIAMQPDHDAAHEWLAENDGLYLESSPGMVLPVKTAASVFIQSQSRPVVVPHYPEDHASTLVALDKGRWQLTVTLTGHGRRPIGVTVGDHTSWIEFWGIEQPEHIYAAQAAFILAKQWETDPADPAYHAFLMWDMATQQRVNARSGVDVPRWMLGGSDEVGLVNGLFLSEWNVYRPVEDQIRALQAYCVDFIEDRLTEQPGWRVHRAAPWFSIFDPWTNRGADDVWRSFNYVHVVNTYYNMYRITDRYEYEWLGEKRVWLEKAYFYARAMFAYWMFPDGEGADRYGNMGESVMVLELCRALRTEGFEQEAAELAAHIEKKAHYFASRTYPFGSEMAYDSTAFEAVYAYGASIGDHRVMRSAMRATLANRGRQPDWRLYMTDLRACGDSAWNVSYMTQLGAFTFYDWALQQKVHEPEVVAAFYASYLAGFAVYNSGGHLSAAPENAGATGWIAVGELGSFTGRDDSRENHTHLKGVVALSGEAPLGFFGALRCAASVVSVTDGKRSALGGDLEELPGGYRFIPSDGLRARFFDLDTNWSVVVERDALTSTTAHEGAFGIVLENITGDMHNCLTWLRLPVERAYDVVTEEGDILPADAHGDWICVHVPMQELTSTTIAINAQ